MRRLHRESKGTFEDCCTLEDLLYQSSDYATFVDGTVRNFRKK